MASYAYPNSNPVVPPNQEQQSYPNYGGYPNQQPDNQWNQASAYGQPAANPAYPVVGTGGYDQQNAYATNPQANYAAAAGDYTNYQSYGGGGGGYNQQKGGNPNFRGGNNRNSGPGFNKGPPRSNFGAPGGMEEQQDTIFVSGIAENTTEDDLKDYFGAIGLIKIDKKTRKPKIWVYKDKETGKPKGEVTITYDDPPTASSAINWFNGKEFNGTILKVELAQRKNSFLAGGNTRNNNNFGGNRDRNNRDFDRKDGNGRNNSGGGGPPREGDWVCSNCENNNFAWRDSCNRCKTEKPSSAGGGNGGSDRRSNLPYERRGNQMNGSRDRGSFGGPRNNNRNPQDRGSFGGRGGGGRNGGPMRGSSDNRRTNPY